MTEDGEAILTTDNLSKSFLDADGGRLSVIEGLTLSLPPGKVTTVLGASGCGKSTLLKLLAGLEAPDTGLIISELTRPGKDIGYLRQSERLLPWRNVLENVALGLELLGGNREVALSESIKLLTEVGMAEFAAAYPAELSGGMTQRVLLARTLVTTPSLLLLDEPLGQLDIVARQALADIIRKYVRDRSAAALLVTHSVEEAVFISDVVLTLGNRPSKVVERLVIGSDVDAYPTETLDRHSSFEVVLQSLLNALGTDQRQR